MNDCTFDQQALVDLIDKIKIATDRKQEYFYFCYNEPSDEVKEILKGFGMKYKIIPNKFISDIEIDENTALIIPKCEQYIKLEFDQNENY